MNIRIFSPYFPVPFHDAALHVIHNQCLELSRKGHAVELVCWKTSASRACAALHREALQLPPQLSVRFLNEAHQPLYKIAELMATAGEATAESETETRGSRAARLVRSWVGPLASPELFYYPPRLDLRNDLPEVDMEIYHYSFAYSWLRRTRPRARRTVVHFHNLESQQFLDRAREVGTSRAGRLVHRLNSAKLARHEDYLGNSSLGLVDEIWQLSPVDLDALSRRGKGSSRTFQRLVPPSIEENLFRSRQIQFQARVAESSPTLDFGFIGGLDYGPNRASVEWILRHVAPLLKLNQFEGKLRFVGKRGPPQWHARLPHFSFVEFAGFVKDPEDFWRRLSGFLVPHITGSGVRVKLLEALASGVPSLANGAAAGALSPELRKSPLLTISDDPAQWARALIEQKPLELRQRLATEPFPMALKGTVIYKFLDKAEGTSGEK